MYYSYEVNYIKYKILLLFTHEFAEKALLDLCAALLRLIDSAALGSQLINREYVPYLIIIRIGLPAAVISQVTDAERTSKIMFLRNPLMIVTVLFCTVPTLVLL